MYIYVGKSLVLPEFLLSKGTVYSGEKIKELREKYKLLDRLLIPVEEFRNVDGNREYYNSLVDEIVGGIKNGL